MRHILRLTALSAALSLGIACGAPAPTPGANAGETPTIEELRNATFEGLEDLDGRITLADGAWEDVPNRMMVTLPRDFHVVGDLDGSAPDEAVVVLAVSSGGSGTFGYLAVVARRNGQASNIATAPLGDRVDIRNMRIENRTIVVDVLQAGPGDAMCCPGELATRIWSLEGSTLTELPSSGPTERLSIAAIGGGTWVLRSWNFDETAPTAPAVTLQLSEDRLVGSSGCNTYNAAITPGETPSDLKIGPVASTRMMCPDAEMQVEDRFLSQLDKVTSFGFLLGELSLTYQTETGIGVMLFERQ
jgi:heat shock protein HslJ